MLGGRAPNDLLSWSAPGVDPVARHLFSLNTCDGCHGVEANVSFLHVFPRTAGVSSALSTFMTGGDVVDPVTGTTRHFHDLERRNVDLEAIVCNATTVARSARTSSARQGFLEKGLGRVH